jgi:hypothetical protein
MQLPPSKNLHFRALPCTRTQKQFSTNDKATNGPDSGAILGISGAITRHLLLSAGPTLSPNRSGCQSAPNRGSDNDTSFGAFRLLGRYADQSSLKQIDFGSSVHLPVDQFEFRDLTFCLLIGPRQRDSSANVIAHSDGFGVGTGNGVPFKVRRIKDAHQAQNQATQGRDLSTPAPLRALWARTPDRARARHAVGEGMRSCPRAGCGRAACPVR